MVVPSRKPRKAVSAPARQEEPLGDSQYRRAKDRFGEDDDALYEYLRYHRLEDTTLCLGFYLMRAQRELNLNQADVAERTRTKNDPPITRSFLSVLLGGRSGIRADTWVRIANALDANPLEFFIAEGWIEPGHISSYQVPHSDLMLPLATKLDEVRPEFRQSAVAMIVAVIDTVLLQQKTLEGRSGVTSSA